MSLIIKRSHVFRLRDFFIDILFPIECLRCKKEGAWICENCYQELEKNYFQYCLNCKEKNDYGKICEKCEDDFYIDGILIAGNYQDKLLSQAIKTFKYKFVKNLSIHLGKFLSEFLFEQIIKEREKKPEFIKNIKDTIIIPVPLHKKRLNWRGFNQSEELAKILAKKFSLEISTELKRIRHKKPQTQLKKQKRKENIKNCFAWSGEKIQNKNIILIDDVTTTGSTLNECAKILKENGVDEVWGLVLANG